MNLGDKMQDMDVVLQDEYITLGQLLKHLSLIDTGGMAKWYLQEFAVFVNGEEDRRRGRKIYPNDEVIFPHDDLRVMIHDHRKSSYED